MDLTEKMSCGRRHPWELSRTGRLLRLVLDIFKKHPASCAADIGAGDGFFIQTLYKTVGMLNNGGGGGYAVLCC